MNQNSNSPAGFPSRVWREANSPSTVYAEARGSRFDYGIGVLASDEITLVIKEIS
ncbi:MAG: hypothetical protein ACYT04_39270 [Nostoc sp.]